MIVSLLMTIFAAPAVAENRVQVAQIPNGVDTCADFSVQVRTPGGTWQPVGCYAFRVDEVKDAKHNVRRVSVAKFAFQGAVEVAVTSQSEDIDSYKIRPQSYGISAKQDGRTLTFTLDRPRYLSVEINGKIFGNLHIFADSIIARPKVKRRDLIYFGPGVHYLGDGNDSLAIPSGKTVIIDDGAVVRGWLSVYKSHDVKIIGHGIVMPNHHEGIMVRYSDNVVVDGPLTTQIPVGSSRNVSISNAKAISWYGWGDGMNIFASEHINYRHVFCRTSDDCSTIYCTRKDYHGGCRDISVRDAVYWADVAHPIMIGLHSETDEQETIEDVTYSNIDILDQAENQIDYQGCIAINNGDDITVRNVLFDNIRIESLRRGMLLNFRVCYNRKYCRAPGRGIENITLRDISYNGTPPNMSIIAGYDDRRKIKNIRFENLTINGTRITDDMPGKPKWYKTADMANFFVGEHVENITFK